MEKRAFPYRLSLQSASVLIIFLFTHPTNTRSWPALLQALHPQMYMLA